MADSRDYAVNARISAEAGRRLKALSKSRRQSFGEIIDALILAVPLTAVEWEKPIADLAAQVVELTTKVSALETRTVTASHDSDTPPLSDTTPIAEVPEPPEAPPLADIDDVITGLWRKGLGPQAIADELNKIGYRTKTGTLIQRGWVGNAIKRLLLC
jgi:hypothetical protein